METLIKIEDLSFAYPLYSAAHSEEQYLFEHLNYSIRKGEFHTIIGAPESGKTTLSRVLTGLVPRYTGGTLSGAVTISGRNIGHNIDEFRPQDLVDTIGTIFQNPDDQILTTRVDSEIAYPLESLGYERQQIAERVERELVRFELTDKIDRNPATLSGGEKKRLLCAVLAAVSPPVWILDETIDEMDSHWRKILTDYLYEQQITVVLFSSKMPAEQDTFRQQNISILSEGRLHTEAETIQQCAEKDGLKWRPQKNQRKQQPAEERTELLKAESIEFRYRESTDFHLQIDSFSLYSGETVTLAGPNGCGKTTLAKVLCGLYTPSEGSISLPYAEEVPASPEFLRSSAAYMFQNPDYQIFLPSVEEELAYGLKEKGLSNDLIGTLVEKAIQTFQLPPAETSPTLLSYGTRKRLQAATYWLLERPICIFDETDSGISPKDFAHLISVFQSPDRAILIISHDAELAQHFSDRLFRMETGKIRTQQTGTS